MYLSAVGVKLRGDVAVKRLIFLRWHHVGGSEWKDVQYSHVQESMSSRRFLHVRTMEHLPCIILLQIEDEYYFLYL